MWGKLAEKQKRYRQKAKLGVGPPVLMGLSLFDMGGYDASLELFSTTVPKGFGAESWNILVFNFYY